MNATVYHAVTAAGAGMTASAVTAASAGMTAC